MGVCMNACVQEYISMYMPASYKLAKHTHALSEESE